MEAKLMSYNQNDFQDKAHMEMFISQVEKQVDPRRICQGWITVIHHDPSMEQAGKVPRWQLHWAYRDEKAFIDCQKLNVN